MSTQVNELPKRRGRPPKNPEDKIQDLKAYNKERYYKIKETDEYKEKMRQIYDTEEYKVEHRRKVGESHKRLRAMYNLVKHLSEQNLLTGLPEEYRNSLTHLLQPIA